MVRAVLHCIPGMSGVLARLAFDSIVRMRLWKKLATQIKHGLDMELALRRQRDRALTGKSYLANVYDEALGVIGAGGSLGDAFQKFAPSEEILLIGSGQKAGTSELVNSLYLAAEVIGAKRKIGAAVREAVVYPLVLLGLIAVFLFIVATYLVPNMAAISDPESWAGSAKLLYLASSFLVSPYGSVTAVLAPVALWLALSTMPSWTGGLRMVADKFPPWSIYRLSVGTIWLFTVATLMRSGISLEYALKNMLTNPATRPWLYERVKAILVQYGHGANLGEAMHNARMDFPDAGIVDELRDYASLPGFHDKLHDIATEWLSDGVEKIQRQTAILKSVLFTIIICTGGSSLTAIYSLQQQITGGGQF